MQTTNCGQKHPDLKHRWGLRGYSRVNVCVADPMVWLTVQSDGQLGDLTDPLLLLGNRWPHELLKLLVQNRDGIRAAALWGKLPDASDGCARLLAPELILKGQHKHTLCLITIIMVRLGERNVGRFDHLLHGLLQSASHLQCFPVVADTSFKISHLSVQLVDGVLCLPGRTPIFDLWPQPESHTLQTLPEALLASDRTVHDWPASLVLMLHLKAQCVEFTITYSQTCNLIFITMLNFVCITLNHKL